MHVTLHTPILLYEAMVNPLRCDVQLIVSNSMFSLYVHSHCFSAKLGLLEDLEDMKREEEELERKEQLRRKEAARRKEEQRNKQKKQRTR